MKSETTSAPRPFLALSFTKANCPFVKLPAYPVDNTEVITWAVEIPEEDKKEN